VTARLTIIARGLIARGLIALSFILATNMARADEARDVPAVGTKLTYRLVSTTKMPAKTIGGGQVYTYIVTSSDGATAEGRIKPVAKILYCAGGTDDLGCQDAAKSPGAHFDGDLLTVPISSESSDALATYGGFKLAHFLLVSRQLPMPSSRDPKEYDLSDFGPDPAYILSTSLDCDLAALSGFLPLGKAPQVTLPCETTFERSASRDGKFPAVTNHDTISMEISYAGSGWVTLRSGNWQVQKLDSKLVPKDPGHLVSETEALFSTELGATVRTHTTGTNPADQSTTEITIELVSVSP
jgi:hypothetical protein